MNKKENTDIPLEKAIEITQQLKEKYPQINQILSDSGDYSTENPIISENDETKAPPNEIIEATSSFFKINSSEELATKTDLSPKQIIFLTQLTAIAELEKTISLEASNLDYTVMDSLKRHLISKSRMGRTEFKEIMKSLNVQQQTTEQLIKRGWFRR